MIRAEVIIFQISLGFLYLATGRRFEICRLHTSSVCQLAEAPTNQRRKQEMLLYFPHCFCSETGAPCTSRSPSTSCHLSASSKKYFNNYSSQVLVVTRHTASSHLCSSSLGPSILVTIPDPSFLPDLKHDSASSNCDVFHQSSPSAFPSSTTIQPGRETHT